MSLAMRSRHHLPVSVGVANRYQFVPGTFIPEGRMGLIILLIIFVGLAAIIVWVADWSSGGRRYTALAVLNRRLATGEIDRAEYEEKRKLIGR